jgi:PAB-dependent poly(A)-specific ribonuclease subunit 2
VYTRTVSLPYSNTQSPNTNYIYQLLTEHPHPVTTQPLNFLRTLRQVREAAALGLIEGKDVELDTRLDQSYARRIQAFQRFILEQLHKEEMLGVNNVGGRGGKNTHSNGENKSNENDNDINGGVESLFALTSTQTHSCAQCKHVEVRTARSFQTDLAVSFILPCFRIGD